MRTWQRTYIKVQWTIAQRTMIWFMTGLRPQESVDRVLVNGAPWEESAVHVEYQRYGKGAQT